MADPSILRDILIIFSVSIGIVFLFQKLRLPSIAGFIVAGTVVGPYGLNLISDHDQVRYLAEIGVILLLFTIGLEFSLTHLKASRNLFLIGGPIQILSMLLLTFLGAFAVGLPARQAIFWGLLLSLSSTAIVLKAIAERGESETLYGRSTIGILIFQDLAVVAMILIAPLLAEQDSQGIGEVVLTLGQSGLMVAVIVVTARVIVPRLLQHIVSTRSRELFLLTVVVLGLGTAWLTSLAGLSLALGAFIAGLLISESEYSHQAIAEILPVRDSFNSLFFVSIGMLMDPHVLLTYPALILLLVVLVITGKFFTGVGAVLAAGAPFRSAILSGIALAQVGEFGFILAQEGHQLGILSLEAYNVFLVVSVLTMIITPFLIQWSPRLARRTEAMQRLHHWWPRRMSSPVDAPPLKLRDHVVIVGYGLNGRNLARVLREVEIPHVILEIRGDVVQREVVKGVPIRYGDATNPTVLKHVQIDSARVLVIATSDPFGARRIVCLARALAPSLHIVVRTRYLKELDELLALGANEVIPEEFETSIEIFTLVLQTYHVPQSFILEKAEQIRREGYALLRRGELPELAHHLRAGTLLDVEVETCRIDEDSPALGKSLEELHIRLRTGASVIALMRGGITQSNPSGKMTLELGDVLVLLGNREQIRRAISLLVDTKPALS
ncbi:MAG: sodium:proton exchanger [Nitrospirae bacterium]|nr:MAG: sodium:proton exchanger [Nitrospirota bacterium]